LGHGIVFQFVLGFRLREGVLRREFAAETRANREAGHENYKAIHKPKVITGTPTHFIFRSSGSTREAEASVALALETPDRGARLGPIREISDRRRLLRVSVLVYRTRGREKTN